MRVQVLVEVEAAPWQTVTDVAGAVVEVLRFSGMDPESDHFGPPVILLRSSACDSMSYDRTDYCQHDDGIDCAVEEETRA